MRITGILLLLLGSAAAARKAHGDQLAAFVRDYKRQPGTVVDLAALARAADAHRRRIRDTRRRREAQH